MEGEMTTAITQETGIGIDALESILVEGNLEKLSAEQRLDYYAATCKSLGLNPLTKPFAYIKLSRKTTLYALKEPTDQLRKIHGISGCIRTDKRCPLYQPFDCCYCVEQKDKQ